MLIDTPKELRTKLMRFVQDAVADEVNKATDRVLTELRNREIRDRRDIFAAGEREAVASSAEFAYAHMQGAPTFPNPHETLRYALSLAPAEGMALEFGVYTGSTLRTIAKTRRGPVYGFGSFEGLPATQRADFSAGTLPRVRGAELLVGMFEDTVPGFLADHPEPVTFLHIDSDLYESATTVLKHVGPRLEPGSIILFDEFFNFPRWQDYEYRAWSEYCRDSGMQFRYEGYTLDNEQVIVRVLGE